MDIIIDNENFKTISEFIECMNCGGEVQFLWNEKEYYSGRIMDKLCVYECNVPDTEIWFETIDEMLDHIIDGEVIRDIITKVEVLDRTI